VQKSFLIIQTAFIGDVVLATALVEKLRIHYPEAKIDFLLRKGNEGLLQGHPHIRKVLVWDKSYQKLRNKFRLLARIREERYDVVVNVQRYLATGFLTAFSGAAMRVGFDLNPMSFLFNVSIPHASAIKSTWMHETTRNQQLISHLTDKVALRPKLYPSESDRDRIAAYTTAPYICIAPTSVWFTKQYPPERWVSFIQKVPASFKIFLIAGPGDIAICDEICRKSEAHDRILNLAGRLSFLQTAALQKGAAMNFVNDSAPLHFASAMNAPVTAVFCSTIPAFGYGPLSDVSHVVEVNQHLPCRPCGIHGKNTCPKAHFHCAMLIDDTQLLQCLPAVSC
jgi:heptosyltransferase-2